MKKLRQYLLTLSLFLLPTGYAYAQGNGFGSAKHAVGVSAGGAIGSGITYRAYLSNSFIQGSFFARANRQEDVSDLMIGLSYGRILSQISIVKALPPTALVFVAGLDGKYAKNQYIKNAPEGELGTEKAFHSGVGIALEIGNTFSPGLLFSLGTTYMLSMEQTAGDWEWNLGPQVTAGFLYNW